MACVLALGLASAACMSGKAFPSLALRPAERLGDATSAPSQSGPQAGPQASSSALISDTIMQLTQLQETARSAHVRFAARRAVAERAAATAGPLGSESWAAASVALASLEEAHDQQAAALTSVDQLEVDRRVAEAGAEETGVTTIVAARDTIAAAADADGAVLAQLRQRLSK